MGHCSLAINSSLTMRIPSNCQKGPIKSILKTSTEYSSPCVDHQHHLNQKNPSSTAKDEENHEQFEKQLKEDVENRARRLEEFEEAIARDQAEHLSMMKRKAHKQEGDMARSEEDRVQRTQKANKSCERDKQRDNQHYVRL